MSNEYPDIHYLFVEYWIGHRWCVHYRRPATWNEARQLVAKQKRGRIRVIEPKLHLQWIGWTDADGNTPPMKDIFSRECWSYFDGDIYLGPDPDDGIEPLFDVVREQ